MVTDCDDVNGSCVGGDEEVGGSATETLTLDLSAGTTYYIIVDGWNNSGNTTGSYTLTVDYTAPTCAAYCAAVTTNCTGEFAQYTDEAACLAYCGTWAQLPVGAQTDTDGNTVGCRTYHAGVAGSAAGMDAVHCVHAGPSGGDVCGSWCENYCHLSATNCTGGNELYSDDASCTAACGGFGDTGDAGATDGDSVQCRIYHLGVAGSDGDTSAAIHCPHGAVDGGGVCVDPVPQGDTCADPFTVGALPFSTTGNTAGASNDYSYTAGSCPPETGGWGAGSSDHAYAFEPAANGTYHITLSGFDSNLYVVTDCSDVNGSCVGGDEEVGGSATETLTLNLSAGTTYYIIVDGWNNSGNTTGSYTLTVDLAPLPVLPINEVDYDQPGADTAEFVELFNAGPSAIWLAGFELQAINGADGGTLWSASLADAGASLASGQYLVIGDTAVVSILPAGILTMTSPGSIQNGAPDALRLVRVADGAIVDAVSYEGTVPGASEGGSAGNDTGDGSLSRCPNGQDTDDNSADFSKQTSTPGITNACPVL